MRTPHRGLLAIVLTGALATGTGLLNSSTANAAINGEAENIIGSGSDTTIGVMSALDNLFNNLPGCVNVGVNNTPTNGACAPGDTTNASSPNFYHDSISEKYPTNSGIGRKQLCQQGQADQPLVNFSRSSSPQGNECPGLTGVAYAQDAVTPFVFTSVVNADGSNTTTATAGSALPTVATGMDGAGQPIISAAAVNSIYQATEDTLGEACKTAPTGSDATKCGNNSTTATDYWTWQDLGVPSTSTFAAQHVIPYSAPTGSGTLNTFNSKFLGGAAATAKINPAVGLGTAKPHIIEENNGLPIAKNGDTASALFFYSYGRYTAKSNLSTKPGDVAGGAITAVATAATPSVTVPTTETTVGNATAVGYRKIYNIYRFATPGTLAYVSTTGYICSTGRGGPNGTAETGSGTTSNNAVNQTIRQNGFVPFASGPTGVDGTTSYCRVTSADVSALPTDNAGAAPTTIPSGGNTATVTFSRPVLGVSTSNVGVMDSTGHVLASTVKCVDLAGNLEASCPTLAYQDPSQTAQITVTEAFKPGLTYTTFALASGLTDQYAKPVTAGSTAAYATPYVAPATVNVPVPGPTVTVPGPAVPGPTVTVTVPGPTTTTTVTKTVTVTTTLPVLVIGQISISNTTLKLPVTCVSSVGCKGKITLKVSGKTVTKTYSLGKNAITTLQFSNTRPKGAKTGATSLTFQLIPTSGQTSLGKRSGTIKF